MNVGDGTRIIPREEIDKVIRTKLNNKRIITWVETSAKECTGVNELIKLCHATSVLTKTLKASKSKEKKHQKQCVVT